jgi:hypothetical protein
MIPENDSLCCGDHLLASRELPCPRCLPSTWLVAPFSGALALAVCLRTDFFAPRCAIPGSALRY